MTTEVKDFWVVWNPNGRNPSVRHNNFAAAMQEAERLSKQYPGATLFVLKSQAWAQSRLVVDTRHTTPMYTTLPTEVPQDYYP